MKHSGKRVSGNKHLAGMAAAALSLGLFASHAAMAQVIPIGPGISGSSAQVGQTGPGTAGRPLSASQTGSGAARQPLSASQTGSGTVGQTLSASQSGPGTAGQTLQAGQSGPEASERSFRAQDFALPQEARVLVVVEGTGGSSCMAYAYEKTDKGWEERFATPGILGGNGMSNNRTAGDRTTPIGVFRMNTPFGQSEPLEGFPSNYIKVKKSHVWSDDKNRLVDDAREVGEHVGTSAYQGYYDYVIDAGYNPKAIAKKGSALFLHCRVPEAASTGGCVAIAKEHMVTVMRLYGSYGDGACYIAQAPKGTFPLIYGSYGVGDGLSPEGDFAAK